MVRYRKRQLVVDAVQVSEPTPITTVEGATIVVQPGDWVITGIQGEKYPCKDDLFRLTYDPAPPESEEEAKSWEFEAGLVGSAINGVLQALARVEFEPVTEGLVRVKVVVKVGKMNAAVSALEALYQAAIKAQQCEECQGIGFVSKDGEMNRCEKCKGTGGRDPQTRVSL